MTNHAIQAPVCVCGEQTNAVGYLNASKSDPDVIFKCPCGKQVKIIPPVKRSEWLMPEKEQVYPAKTSLALPYPVSLSNPLLSKISPSINSKKYPND